MRTISALALITIAPIAASGCGPGDATGEKPDNAVGPLALIADQGPYDNDAGTGSGVIHIDERCVTLNQPDWEAPLLLVWSSEDVRWSESARSITFDGNIETLEADSITIRDGDVLSLGGSLMILDEDVEQQLPSRDEWTRGYEWIVEPNQACRGAPWLVGSVQP